MRKCYLVSDVSILACGEQKDSNDHLSFFLFFSRYTYNDGVHVSVTAEAEGLFCGHNI